MLKILKKMLLYTITFCFLVVLGFFVFIAYKTAPITHVHVSNPKKVCEEIYKAQENNDFKNVRTLLKKELDVLDTDIFVGSEGVQVQLDGFFVISVGLYFNYNPSEVNNNHFYQYTFFEECIGGYMTD
jgi:hypothetical protein